MNESRLAKLLLQYHTQQLARRALRPTGAAAMPTGGVATPEGEVALPTGQTRRSDQLSCHVPSDHPASAELPSSQQAELQAAQAWVDLLDALWQAPPVATATTAVPSTLFTLPQPLQATERFVDLRPIGAGGMGIVYEAYDQLRQERVALKTVRSADPHAIVRLKREFRALADIQHPNLVALHELHHVQDQWFFSMELVMGERFTDYFRHPTVPLKLGDAVWQLVQGLMALHRGGWLHRDIKPSNVLITPSQRVVILDFGLHLTLHGSQPHAERAAGTWAYMSPEQSAARGLTPASDYYSLGVMLYEIGTGQPPFHGDWVASLCAKQWSEPALPETTSPHATPRIRQLCRQLLRHDPRARPSPVRICQLLRERPRGPADYHQPPDGDSAFFVGRQSELEQLRHAVECVRGGESVQLLLRGLSGYGKTSLAHAFLRQLWIPHCLIVQGRCYENEAVPYKAWDELMDALVDELRFSHQEIVDAIPESDWHALLRLFPTLHRLRPQRDSLATHTAEPALLRHQAARTLRYLLQQLSQRTTLILFIDDLHWGDADSAMLMAEVLHGESPPPMLMIGTYRTEEESSSPFLQTLRDATRPPWNGQTFYVDVGPLQPSDAAKLARHFLPAATRNSPIHTADVLRESQCHPWLIITMSQELLRCRAQRTTPTYLGLDDLLESRVRALPSDARKLLEAVCLATHPLSETVAYRAATLTADRDAMCGELRKAQLVRNTWHGGKPRLAPFHDRIRDICGRTMPASRVKLVHLRLARSLYREMESDPQSIAIHFRQAGQPQRAALFYERAGDHASQTLAFELAADCYRHAVDQGKQSLDQRMNLLEKRATSLAHAGRGAEAATEYQAAARLAPNLPTARRLRRAAAYQFCVSGHIEEGKQEFTQVLRPLKLRLFRRRLPIVAGWLWQQACLTMQGTQERCPLPAQIAPSVAERLDISWEVTVGLTMIDTLQGAYFQWQHLRHALREGDAFRVARACCWQATYEATRGVERQPQVERWLARARQLCQIIPRETAPPGYDPLAHRGSGFSGASAHQYLTALLALSEGISAYFLGHWSQATQACDQAALWFRERCRGVAWEINTSHAFLLWSLFFQGRIHEMAERLPILLDEASLRGDRLAQASLSNFGGPLVWLAHDRPDLAWQGLNQAMHMWPEGEFHVQHFTSLAGRVQVLLYQGQAEQAWQHLRQQWPALRNSFYLQIEAIRIFMVHLRARTALAWASDCPSSRTARRVANMARRDSRRLLREKAPWAKPLAQLIQAGLASLEQQTQQSLLLLEQAIPPLQCHELGLFAWAAQRAIAYHDRANDPAPLATLDADLMKAGIQFPARICQLHLPGIWW